MKSFATLLLAATVSANYCYTDGCNCSGQYRECYSLPRSYMNVDTCCGSSPTTAPQTASLMFGATEDTWSPTARLNADCAAIFQARQCAQVFQARGCRQLGLTHARKECEKNAADVRKECEKNAGDARKECEKAQVSNLQVYGGGQPNTHLAKLDEISVETKNTENTLNEDGFSGHTKNSRYSWTQDADGKPVIVWENKRGSRFGINTSLFSKEHKEKMGKTDGSWNPRDSLDKKNGNWNGNEFTGANVKTGGNTNCGANCGITVNVNKLNAHTMTGTSSATWSPTASLAWNADKCSAYCATYGSYPPTKCTRYGPCEVAPVETAQTSNLACTCTDSKCIQFNCKGGL